MIGTLRVVAVGALHATLACADTTTPRQEGQYMLSRLNGSELPYENDGLGCCICLSGTLAAGCGQVRSRAAFGGDGPGSADEFHAEYDLQ